MADPFQDVDAAGPEFIRAFADSMDERQSDPTMERIVAAYLSHLACAPDTLTVEVGAGAGAVTRRIADHVHPGRVIGAEPSKGFVAEAQARDGARENLSFVVADGAELPFDAASVDHVVLHTVLTHVPDPAVLVAEAARVLKPGGTLVLCDADFSKATLASCPNDPLDACAQAMVREFVTDPHIVSKLRPLIAAAGLTVTAFDLQSRVVTDPVQMLPWVVEPMKVMVGRGDIGQPLADALEAEYLRRAEAGTLYGYQVFATAIAVK